VTVRFILLLALLAACTRADQGDGGASPPLPQTSLVKSAAGPTVATITAVAFDSADAQPDSVPVRFDAAGHPILPIVLRDYCEGEDCSSHFYAVACLPTGLLGTPRDSAAIITQLAVGDTVQVMRRDLRVPVVGVVVMKRSYVLDHEMVEGATGDFPSPRSDTVRLARGDTVYLVSYLALGRWRWAHHGTLHDSDQFWASAADQGLGAPDTDSSRAVALSSAKSEDWWYVQPKSGAPGWWRGDDRVELQSIGGMQKWNDDCAQVATRAAAPKQR
jgi:hypothetical protein